MTYEQALLWSSNALAALHFIERLSAAKVRLSSWCVNPHYRPSEHGCGSVACLGGWVAVMPYFEAQGVFRQDSGAPFGLGGGSAAVALALFGDEELFSVRRWAVEYGENDLEKSDQWVAKNRLLRVIDNCEKKHPAAVHAAQQKLRDI